MRSLLTGGLLLLAALAVTRAASGQNVPAPAPEAVRPPPAQTATSPAPSPSSDGPVRVRASHRVDVIAPGERVETIVDRMRANRPPASTRDGKLGDRLPLRTPDKARDGDRGPPDSRRGPQGGPPPGPGPSNVPPRERMHR